MCSLTVLLPSLTPVINQEYLPVSSCCRIGFAAMLIIEAVRGSPLI